MINTKKAKQNKTLAIDLSPGGCFFEIYGLSGNSDPLDCGSQLSFHYTNTMHASCNSRPNSIIPTPM